MFSTNNANRKWKLGKEIPLRTNSFLHVRWRPLYAGYHVHPIMFWASSLLPHAHTHTHTPFIFKPVKHLCLWQRKPFHLLYTQEVKKTCSLISELNFSKVTTAVKVQQFYSSFGHRSKPQTSSSLHNIRMARRGKEWKITLRFWI